jgi:hypothetical protein
VSEVTVDPKKSILDSTKHAIGVGAEYDVFDPDLIMHINGVLSQLNQLGIGPDEGFMIEGADEQWDTFLGPDPRYNIVKSYVYLKVKNLFDPPATSFLLTAQKEQMEQMEWRMNVLRENDKWGTTVALTTPQ